MGASGYFKTSIGSLRTFSSLRNPVYRLYFLGMLGQFASMNMQMVTGSLLLYRLTGSSALLGTMSLFVAVPMIFLSLFGGAFADRIPKKHILTIGLSCSAIVALVVAILLTVGYLSREHAGSWWVLMASAFLQGSIMGLMMPARQAIIPEIVTHEQVMNAVALNTLGMNVLRLVAPAAAGFLIDTFDFKAVYFAMTAMNLYAVSLILFLPTTGRPNRQPGGILNDIQAGLSYIISEKTVLFVLAFTLIVVILSMPYQQLLPIFVDDILKVGATGMGVLMSVSGIGAMVGSLILASLPNRRRGIILLISGLISGLALTGFSLSTSWGLSLVTIVFVGLGQTGRMTMSNVLLQSYVKSEYMGRVMSIFNVEWGLVSLSTFAAGLLAEVISVQWVIAGFAMILTVLSLLSLSYVKSIRKLE